MYPTILFRIILALFFISTNRFSAIMAENIQRNSFLNFGLVIHYENRYISPGDEHKLASIRVNKASECSLACVQNQACLSANFREDDGTCELLNTDRFNPQLSFSHQEECTHIGIKTPCDSSPCLNGGTCVPDYTKDSFMCKCLKFYKGKVCEGPFKTCQEIFDFEGNTPTGPQDLQVEESGEEYQAYCHMDNISGCGPGGWNLVMKIDGEKGTFTQNSNYWLNEIAYNKDGGMSGDSTQETKLPSYWLTPFNTLCLGMKYGGQTNWINSTQSTRQTLHKWIADGAFHSLSITKDEWRSLIGSNSSMQANCNKGGYNSLNMRIGLVTNNENNCNTCDTELGFGGRYTACGNFASLLGDNGAKLIKTFGYILVK